MPTKTVIERIPRVRHSPLEHPRHQYPEETEALQKIAESCGLKEEIKWGKPCYTLEGKNIVLIQRFNDYIALMFFNGALLRDSKNLLCRIGEHMLVPRHLRFCNVAGITLLEPIVRDYIEEAIILERAGAKLPRNRAADQTMPDELQARLDASPALKKAFAALTPGRQKGYILQISAGKQSKTRASRIEKYIPHILAGKGLND